MLRLALADQGRSGAEAREAALYAVEGLLDAAPAETRHGMPALPPGERQRALTLAQETQERGTRHLAMVGAVEDRLSPASPGEDPPDCDAWKLAAVLYELLADTKLRNALVGLLESGEAWQGKFC